MIYFTQTQLSRTHHNNTIWRQHVIFDIFINRRRGPSSARYIPSKRKYSVTGTRGVPMRYTMYSSATDALRSYVCKHTHIIRARYDCRGSLDASRGDWVFRSRWHLHRHVRSRYSPPPPPPPPPQPPSPPLPPRPHSEYVLRVRVHILLTVAPAAAAVALAVGEFRSYYNNNIIILYITGRGRLETLPRYAPTALSVPT